MDAHFLLYSGTDHIIGLSQAAIFIHPYFGHQENGNAFGSLRRPLCPRQDGVNDVVGQVVLAGILVSLGTL